MEFVPKDISQFRSSVEALKEFLPIAQLRISSAGIRISGMDSSHAGFIDFFFAAEDCEKAEIRSPRTIGVHLAVLAKVLSSVGSGDSLTLGINKKDQLVITCYNVKMAKKAVYEISTLDIDDEPLEIPVFQYGADITIKTADLHAVIKEMMYFGERIGFTLNEDGLHLSTTGDQGNVNQTLENTEDREMVLNSDSVEAHFGMKYIVMVFKGGAPLAATMQLEFDPAQPLKATFRFGDNSYFIAYLAPKVMDDN